MLGVIYLFLPGYIQVEFFSYHIFGIVPCGGFNVILAVLFFYILLWFEYWEIFLNNIIVADLLLCGFLSLYDLPKTITV